MPNHGPSARWSATNASKTRYPRLKPAKTLIAPDLSDEVRDYIRAYIEMEYGTIKAAAQAWGLTYQYLSTITSGRMKPPVWILKEVGLAGTMEATAFLDEVPPRERPCPCLPGRCQRAARECVDWIKRAANQQQTKG